MRRKSADHYKTASIPTNAKLRAFRCQDFTSMSRQERLAYANAIHAAIRTDNKRQGQSYKPRWKNEYECQAEYDSHMLEQRKRLLLAETNRHAEIALAVSRFAADLDMIAADIRSNQLAA